MFAEKVGKEIQSTLFSENSSYNLDNGRITKFHIPTNSLSYPNALCSRQKLKHRHTILL